jgi:hypothetical protein
MKPVALVGAVVLLLGIAALAFGRFSYTTEKQVVAVGPLTASVAEQHSVALPDIAGFGMIVVGGLLLLVSRRNS